MHRMSSNRRAVGEVGWLLPAVISGLLVAAVLPGRAQTIPSPPGALREWSTALGDVDRALAAGPIPPALRSWEQARGAARASQQWQGLAAVGDAYLRIGDAVELRRAFVAPARGIYLEALERARAAASVEGVLRVAEVLSALDDGPDVQHAIRAACRAVTGRTCEGHSRVDPRGSAS
jgi:hypothetical protein